MYKVYYYVTGSNKVVNKVFTSLHDATMFAVYKVGFHQCGEIVKVS